jgi:hypothetical protein
MPVISFKVSADEARRIRRLARSCKKTVSAYLRDRALPRRTRSRATRTARHPVSGLTFDTTDGPAVTQEEISAALVEFP